MGSEVSVDEIVEPWENLLQRLTVNHLRSLSEFFKENGSFVKLCQSDFVKAIDHILKNSKYSLQAIALYNEVPDANEEKLTWAQFLNFYLKHAQIEADNTVNFTVKELLPIPHVKREPIVKAVLLETNTFFCYAMISKFGKVGLYESNLNLLCQYNVIFMKNDPFFGDEMHRRKSIWVTDAIFLSNICVLIISNSCRSLTFYSASGRKHIPLYLIEGIPSAIQCISVNCEAKPILYLGDLDGYVTELTFHKTTDELFRKKHNDKLSTYYWSQLHKESSHLKIKNIGKMHNYIITSINYYPKISTIVTCSRDMKASVSFYNLKKHRQTYVFKIPQGASCFALCPSLHILIIGNDNGLLQIWDTFVTKQPIGSFLGHKRSIVDVKIVKHRKLVFSCSQDGIFKIWGLTDYKCLQSIKLKFPVFEILGKLIEWGVSSIYPGPKTIQEVTPYDDGESNSKNYSDCESLCTDPWLRDTILISCCNFIAKITVGEEPDLSIYLPPPPIQNDIKLPSDWKIQDLNHVESVKDELPPNSATLNTVPEVFNQKNLINFSVKHDINFKIASLEKTKVHMKKAVSQCAPYCALNLYEIEDITLSENLPIPKWKSTHKLVKNTHRLLSAASTISGILSDRYSRSVSSRSSIVEF